MFVERMSPVKDRRRFLQNRREINDEWVEPGSLSHPRSRLMTMTATADPTTKQPFPTTTHSVIAAAIVVGALALGALGFGGGAAANSRLEPASTDSTVTDAIEIYIVQPGDTLWDIASSITPAGGDVRDTVDYLSSAAGGADLEIGQRIIIDHAALG